MSYHHRLTIGTVGCVLGGLWSLAAARADDDSVGARAQPRPAVARAATSAGQARALAAEIDRLLNDPNVPMQASRVWTLLAEMSQRGLRCDEEAVITAITWLDRLSQICRGLGVAR